MALATIPFDVAVQGKAYPPILLYREEDSPVYWISLYAYPATATAYQGQFLDCTGGSALLRLMLPGESSGSAGLVDVPLSVHSLAAGQFYLQVLADDLTALTAGTYDGVFESTEAGGGVMISPGRCKVTVR